MDLNDFKEFYILGREFYSRDTAEVAKSLLGKLLVKSAGTNNICAGYITETEAYYGTEDPASHAHRGVTPRCEIMFGKAGIAYVYFCYGFHYMLNAVTEKEGVPGAVLLRAVSPVLGLEDMFSRRKILEEKNLANGPGKLTNAFGIDIGDNGKDLTDPSGNICILGNKNNSEKTLINIKSSSRIGIKKGRDKYLRFFTDQYQQGF
jgi:DNA-3-methyladenine glycosylase